ncbi:glycine cleavage system aminomethyltransferase GcvT [Microbacterium timonense]|uniref:glycine cleavage system aminomethyltransferase GcvT n=1 Tax=Microbacterium timonense TaxID=2086576 RepID=UPI000D0FCDF1|nr:glycine cleavage system aminomethyltransferase GcvT [Microbacterium timonense]
MTEPTAPHESAAPAGRVTALHDRHRTLGASFTDFGGWLMPVRYSSDLAEHHAVRTAAGLFDISHMAEFTLTGPDAASFLDYALAGVISAMRVGKAKYSLVLAESGGIVDDVIVYRIEDARFLVIANAGNRDAVATALSERAGGYEVEVADDTDDMSLIAVQGPAARVVLKMTTDLDGIEPALDELGYYAWAEGVFGHTPVFIARTGYTGEDGYELLVDNDAAGELWDRILEAGDAVGLVPAGLAARDTLRLEAGMPLYGHELSLDVSPAQAGLGRVVAFDKEDFVGKSGLLAAASDAPVLVGLVSEGRRAGRAGYPVFADPDAADAVGEVTSGALSPTLGHPIAMAFVAPDASEPGTVLFIDVRGTRIPATVTTLPFYRRNP